MRRAGGTRARRRHYGPAGATGRLRRGPRRRAGRCGFSTAPRGPKSLPGDDGAGGASIAPPGRWRGGRRPLFLLLRLRGRPGGGQRPGSPARPVASRDPPPAPPAGGRGDDGAGGASIVPPGRWRGGRRPLFLLPRLRGRPGGGQRPGSPARPVTSGDPPPAPPAGGRGDDGAGGASIVPPGRRRGGWRPLFLLPRLRGRPGGGQRPGNPARPVAARDPPPAPPASGRGDDGADGASIVPPGRWRGRVAAFISPPPLAGEAGRGPAAGQPGKARRGEGPSPSPSRKREGG